MTQVPRPLLSLLVLVVFIAAPHGQSRAPKTHRLEATPETVAYGYYWSEAKPVLRIASGDIIDVDTLLTSTPDRPARAGVPPEKIQDVAQGHRRRGHRRPARARAATSSPARCTSKAPSPATCSR